MPLALANLNEEMMIKRIGGSQDLRLHLEKLGFVVGAFVRFITQIDGNIIVNIKESRVAISKEMAMKIIV